nr:histidine kinase [Clostridia bacterium]
MKLKISQKLIVIFSVMMLAVISTFYVIASNMLLKNSTASDNSRFSNMGAIIVTAVEQQISMMDITAEELLGNLSFMSALNQYVSNDSADGKVANAARNALLQQLYNSPMVDSFHRVSFYNTDGDFFSSRYQKDDYLESGTPQAQEVISDLPWLADESAATRRQILPLHNDFLSVRRDISVYGIVQPVLYHGKLLGYLEISNEKSALSEIIADAADSDVLIQAVFDDGTIFFTNSDDVYSYPADMDMETMVDYIDEETGVHHHVMYLRSNWLGLNFYLAQDYSIISAQHNKILLETAKVALFIMLPTFAIIIIVSRALSHSALLLKEKVRSFPLDHVVEMPPETLATLHTTVSAPFNVEIYELERSFNRMMLRLQESIHNEMTLHESTLQARLKALQMQINPHFIYNTLNIISAHSVESENWEICEICDQFAQLLRYSTDSHSETATLAAEIDNARNYLQLAKARYEEDLEYTIDVPGNLHELTIPKLTLQPIIENAMNHGFTGTDTRRCLSITGTVQENNLILEIRDNGSGFAPEVLERLQADIRDIERGNGKLLEAGNHIGLINTCLRLHYYSRGTMRISLRNDSGAVVRLSMPC